MRLIIDVLMDVYGKGLIDYNINHDIYWGLTSISDFNLSTLKYIATFPNDFIKNILADMAQNESAD